ncbi:MAG: acetate--CoA ligase [Desulfobulbaceae bacterium]|nr:acetate--CoA ligase [Candidatus Kapabacteria bacterium]MBS4001281.1 acetate--CoA ligase [Desulfobulbaceae bacterium]
MGQIELTGDVYYPSPETIANANLKDRSEFDKRAEQDYEGFWADFANELDWFQKWDKVIDDSEKPFYKWFTGGRTNISYNCLDRHVKTYRRNKLALIWEGEDGEHRTMSYFRLHNDVCRFANLLKSMAVKKGDRVTIYMGRTPEIIIAMLACARIGAVHSVVYGGFSVESLTERIEDSQSRVLIVADGAYQRGKIVKLKDIADEALQRAGTVEHVIVVKRTGQDVYMEPGRDMWYHELNKLPIANQPCVVEETSSEDPLFILYTSGTTGKPKAILHTHGGYMVGTYVTTKYYLDVQDADRIWCTADPGWITGHSYIVYGPLLNGATIFMYEGAPYHPYPNRWWQMIEKYGINILYTAPTAIRGFMRFGDSWANRHDLSSLRILGSVGEPINPEAWKWYHRVIGRERCPVIDTWWQTETGMHMISPFPTMPLKPGSGSLPFPGVKMEVVDEQGNPVKANEEGYLIIKTPWPAMVRTIFNDPQRMVDQYWTKYPGAYMTGDSAKIDEDGYIWVIGRVDDVIKVSGYRLGTAEIESAFVSHHAVAEAAAIGVPHEIKGNAIYAYIILKQNLQPSDELIEELRKHIAHEVGPIAKPEHIEFVDKLPKTRSGKIMRRVLKAQAMGEDPGNISTLEE